MGELLLTTGLTLPRNGIDCRRYVARLVEAEVSALALGLGPVHQRPPQVLVNACREAGLTLLAVPAPTPFLTISRAFWQAVSRSTEQQLNDAVAAHRALVDAAVAPDPAAAILRRLARVLDGWAALLNLRGEVDQIYPLGWLRRSRRSAPRPCGWRLPVRTRRRRSGWRTTWSWCFLWPRRVA